MKDLLEEMGSGFGIELMGFTPEEIANLTGPDAEIEEPVIVYQARPI